MGGAVDGTVGGVTLGVTDVYGSDDFAGDFDGVNDVVGIADNNEINLQAHAQRTVEVVFNADITSGTHIIYEEGGGTNAFNIYIDNGSLYVGARDANEFTHFISTGISAGQTYHAAFVFDSSGSNTFTGYLNGVAFGSQAVTTDMDAHSGDIGFGSVRQDTYLHTGAVSGTGLHYFDGTISEVAIYNSALTAGELLDHYNVTQLNSDPHFADGNDTLRGGDGNDTLYASGGRDTLLGEADNDILYGASGREFLYGGDGNDTIYADGYQITAAAPPSGSATLASVILADNPGTYHDLSETSGSVADNQGSGGAAVDGTTSGGPTMGAAALYTGGGTSFDFDGVNDLVNLPDTSLINSGTFPAKTVELVFNADNTTGRQVIYEEGGTTHGITIYLEGTSLIFTAEHDGQYNNLDISTTISAGTTYHVGFTLSSADDEFVAYVNGASIGSASINSQDFPSHTGNISIGGATDGHQLGAGPNESGSAGNYFDGRISDVATYTDALTASDFLARYNVIQGNPVSPDPVDDSIYGGDGLDTLYGGDGRDIFFFEAASAFNDIDIVNDFDVLENDSIDISDILTGYTDGVSDINDFVQFTDAGANMLFQVDADGSGGFSTIAQINGINGQDVDAWLANVNIIPV